MKSISKMKILFALVVCLLIASSTIAAVRQEIHIPDIMGYRTLKCDLHTHTVFSDGSVWPSVRVDEAWREGLDAIAITDHIEYQPHKNDIPTNHKRPYEIAYGPSKAKNILLVKGTEITRGTPPGHFNAIFITDFDAIDTQGKAAPDSKNKTNDEVVMALRIAKEQGAITFWNHPNWQAKNGEQVWFDIHTKIHDEKLVDGIEVVNGSFYYDNAFKWALERNLIMFGNSDIHSPADPPAHDHENHRPVTLVFAEDKSLDSLKEALLARRTAVWSDDRIIGKEEYLEAILAASIEVTPPYNQYRGAVYFEVKNNSDINFEFEKISGPGPGTISLPAQKTVIVKVHPDKETKQAELSYKVTNFLIGPGKNLVVSGTISAME